MSEYYSVLYKNVVIAAHMELHWALIFVRAFLQEYWQTNDIEVTIKREINKEDNANASN